MSKTFWRKGRFVFPYSIHQYVSSHLSLEVAYLQPFPTYFYLLYQTQIMCMCKQLGHYSNIQDEFFKSTILTTLFSSSGILSSFSLPIEQSSSSSLGHLRLPTHLMGLHTSVSVFLSNVCSISQQILCTQYCFITDDREMNQSPCLLGINILIL